MESDREQDDRLTGRMGEVFRPCEVFFPSPLVQAMQQDNRLIILFTSRGREYGIRERFVLLDTIVCHRTESGGGKSLLELVDLAGSTGLGEAKRDDLQMALFQFSLFVIREKTVQLLSTK